MHTTWMSNKFKAQKKPEQPNNKSIIKSFVHTYMEKGPTKADFFHASDYAKIYNFPTPKSAVFGIVAFGGGLYGNTTLIPNSDHPTHKLTVDNQSDMFKSWSLYGISPMNFPTVYLVSLLGVRNVPVHAATMENTLDVTTIGACCPHPNAIIVVYLAPNTSAGWNAAFKSAVSGTKINRIHIKPYVISCSWGGPERIWSKNDLTGNGINKILSTSTAPICVATGDTGANNGHTSVNVNFPASSPFVIACGGTSLTCPTRSYAGAGTVETAWSYTQKYRWGGGGGYSQVYTMPSWQSNLSKTQPVLAAAKGMRAIPDIAMNADPVTGVQMYVAGTLLRGMGGTSIVAPAVAALIGCINTPSITPAKLYKTLSYPPYYDIKSGTIGAGVNATINYDCCTGIGSMDGKLLSAAIISQRV